MTGQRLFRTQVSAFAIALGALSACSDVTKPDFTPVEAEGEEICEASRDWLPTTPELPQFLPVPHPAGECPFYRSGWQNFLVAMQPDPVTGNPALVKYPTIDQVFTHAKPHGTNRAFLGDIKQAGGRQILIDQNGNSLYYGIHVNQAFAEFIHQYGLETAAGLQAYPTAEKTKNLVFPPGVVEFKSAWQIIEGTAEQQAKMKENYITMDTTVPTLSQDPVTFKVSENRDMPRAGHRAAAGDSRRQHAGRAPRVHLGQLRAQHGQASGITDTSATDFQRDVAPILRADNNPDPIKDPDQPVRHGGAQHGRPRPVQGRHDGQARQQASPGIRDAPGGPEVHAARHDDAGADVDLPDVPRVEVEHHRPRRGDHLAEPQRRGAVQDASATATSAGTTVCWARSGWTSRDTSRRTSRSRTTPRSPMLRPGKHVAQDGTLADPVALDVLTEAIKTDGSDSEFSILAGEDRMSSTAMESFTQSPTSFNNCFTCHNTQAITVNGIPTDRDTSAHKLLDPGLLNVSHILSQFLLEEYEDSLVP